MTTYLWMILKCSLVSSAAEPVGLQVTPTPTPTLWSRHRLRLKLLTPTDSGFAVLVGVPHKSHMGFMTVLYIRTPKNSHGPGQSNLTVFCLRWGSDRRYRSAIIFPPHTHTCMFPMYFLPLAYIFAVFFLLSKSYNKSKNGKIYSHSRYFQQSTEQMLPKD